MSIEEGHAVRRIQLRPVVLSRTSTTNIHVPTNSLDLHPMLLFRTLPLQHCASPHHVYLETGRRNVRVLVISSRSTFRRLPPDLPKVIAYDHDESHVGFAVRVSDQSPPSMYQLSVEYRSTSWLRSRTKSKVVSFVVSSACSKMPMTVSYVNIESLWDGSIG